MSTIAEEINTARNNLASAYQAVEAKGGDIPENLNLVNLSQSITSIPSGGIEEEIDPIFMNQGASIEAVESEDLEDITIVVEGRDTLTPGQMSQLEDIISERFWFGTQEEYDDIEEKIPTTIYFIEQS